MGTSFTSPKNARAIVRSKPSDDTATRRAVDSPHVAPPERVLTSQYSSAWFPFDGEAREHDLFTFGWGDPVPGLPTRVADLADCNAKSTGHASSWGSGGVGAGAVTGVCFDLHAIRPALLPKLHESLRDARPVLESWCRRTRLVLDLGGEALSLPLACLPMRIEEVSPIFGTGHGCASGDLRLARAAALRPGEGVRARIEVRASSEVVNRDALLRARLTLIGWEERPALAPEVWIHEVDAEGFLRIGWSHGTARGIDLMLDPVTDWVRLIYPRQVWVEAQALPSMYVPVAEAAIARFGRNGVDGEARQATGATE